MYMGGGMLGDLQTISMYKGWKIENLFSVYVISDRQAIRLKDG